MNISDPGTALLTTAEILCTSEAGERLAQLPNVTFRRGTTTGNRIQVFPRQHKQTLLGIGTSFTESSAFVLAHLEPAKRSEVMHEVFSADGANFPIARTPIGSCDFCVEGKYSYADEPEDLDLVNFDIAVDDDGFSRNRYPGIVDEQFDLLPMIQEAIAIKSNQQDDTLNIIASAWTAPPWMKDIDDWFIKPGPENDYNGTGGALKAGYEPIYADYLVKYLDAYRDAGVDIWGLTPVNEPLGNSGQWESMHFTPASQKAFIRDALGPKLDESQQQATKLLIYDHSRDQLEQWADAIYTEPECAGYVDGAAVHWYESTFKVFEDVFDRVYAKYPEYAIIHTEGCIDDLGNDAPEGVLDPDGYKESNWFDNDAFWWNDNATDWAYSVTWPGVKAEDHPKYTPVHRYARNIIVSMNHWVSGWIDWNIVLDERGGPNHVGNHCGAPIMIDTVSGYVYYTPVYAILKQLSRTIRPGDMAVKLSMELESAALQDNFYACASISKDQLLSIQVLNTSRDQISLSIQLSDQYVPVSIAANALQTIRVQLPP